MGRPALKLVEEMTITSEKLKRKYRHIYEGLFSSPFISIKRLSEALGMDWDAVAKGLKEAADLGIIRGPEARRCSHADTLEYVYFFNAENADVACMEYRELPHVIYNVRLYGFCNSLVISKEKMDIDGEIILEGPRSDYYWPFAPDQFFEQASNNMHRKIRNFNPDDYILQEFIKNHWKETVGWGEIDEILFEHFRGNLRKHVSSLSREKNISRNTIYHWLRTLDKRCTIFVGYYPESLQNYITYVSMFETEYEDFIVDVFSELPASSTFFKVADKLIMFAYLPMGIMKDITPQIANKSYFPLLEIELLNKEIIEKKESAIAGYFWREWL